MDEVGKVMTDAPEKIWAEPDGETLIIHNGNSDLEALIATGYLHEYIRTDVAEARTDKLLELMRTSRFAAHTQSCVRGEIPASQIKMLTEIEMDQVGYILRMISKGE